MNNSLTRDSPIINSNYVNIAVIIKQIVMFNMYITLMIVNNDFVILSLLAKKIL